MKTLVLAAVAGGILLLTAAAQAAPVAGTFGDSSSASFGPLPVSKFVSKNQSSDIAANTGSNAQSPANVTTLLQNVFHTRTTLVGCSTAGGNNEGCAGKVTVTLNGDKKGTIASTTAFRFAAIHGGQYEWLLDFGSRINQFSFENLERGFSNVRLTTPIPGAVLLFAPAVAGIVALRRRRAAA